MKKSDNWRTPKKIYELLNKEFHFDFDPCPYPKPDWGGLTKLLFPQPIFNPSQSGLWVKKAIDESKKGKIIVLLLRLDASTIWFRSLIPIAEIRLFDDRLHFVNENGVGSRSDHASILAIMNGSKKRINLPIIYWRDNI